MLLIAASIFVFFLLNLLLGSVSIPIGSVWNILWGGTDESVIWQNIIWKSRVPQALTALVAGAGLSISGLQMQTVFRNPLGRTFCTWYQFRCQPGSGFRGIVVRSIWRRGT